MFITAEDETVVANMILWADSLEKQRRLLITAGMIACHGRVLQEREVIHVATNYLEDLSGLLRSVGDLDSPFPLRRGNGYDATHPGLWIRAMARRRARSPMWALPAAVA